MEYHHDFEGNDSRGWSMRHGHRRGFISELSHGRASFGKSVRHVKDLKEEDADGEERKVRKRDRWKDKSKQVCCNPTLSEEVEEAMGSKEASWETWTPKPNAERWEEAKAKADCSAKVYAVIGPKARAEDHAKPAPAVPTPVPSPGRLQQPPAGAGGPLDETLHASVLEFAKAGSKSLLPACWQGTAEGRRTVEGRRPRQCDSLKMPVPQHSMEYKVVTEYLEKTLCTSDVRVCSLTRLQNRTVYRRYSPEGGETIMFHGCRTMANEESIIKDGFQVRHCLSGGANYGTWFAYGAAYSNTGFVYREVNGLRHIFICAVSYQNTVVDNQTMRVVGQDCAYPLWLVTYTIPEPPPRSWIPKPTAGSRPQVFYVVRDGQWVPEKVKGKAAK